MRGSVALDSRFGAVRGLMLDWDGTLIHSLPLKIENAGRLFAERYGVDAGEVHACYARHSGIPRRQLFDRVAEETIGRRLGEEEFAGLSEAFSAANRDVVVERGRLRPGTRETLEALRADGLRLFVSTAAAPSEVEPLARHFGVSALVDGVFGSRPGFGKGPEHVDYVRRTHDLDRAAMAGVGDDVSDIRLFREAGIVPVGITGTESRSALLDHGAEHVIDRLDELLAASV